jgi:uncharacterized protein (TIGR04255 family)
MESLPKSISPSPLVASTVEIRYKLKQPVDNLLSLVFPLFGEELKIFEPSKITPEIKKALSFNEQSKYLVDFSLSNESYLIGFGDLAMTFENKGEYKYWSNYFPFIKTQLNKFISLGIIESIERVGIRYLSVFENVDIKDVLQFRPSIGIDGYQEDFTHSKTVYKVKEYSILLQLSNHAKIQKDTKTYNGVLIDIDCSFAGNISPIENIYTILDSLHLEEKIMFFKKILKPEFLVKLNPVY